MERCIFVEAKALKHGRAASYAPTIDRCNELLGCTMKMPKHTERSRETREQLATWGFSAEVLQRIGALAVVWSIFESNLETTLWALREESVADVRPSTDKSHVGDWIKELRNPWPKMTVDANEALRAVSLTASDLMDYRHAIMHGALVPDATMPTFIRNPRWHRETRKRPSHAAHVDENLLDMAIDSAWVLCRAIFAAKAICGEPGKSVDWAALKKDVLRAGSLAGELRHLSESMNCEKC